MTMPRVWTHRLPAARAAAVLGLVLLSASLGGCNIFGLATWLALGDEQTVSRKAQYHGLDNKSIAVLVNLDGETALRYKTAQINICQSVSASLAEKLPGTRLVDPQQIAKFQRDNAYWSTRSYNELLAALKVDRLVIVDVSEYSDHEPGDANVWQGVVEADVIVAAADAKNPDDAVYKQRVQADFPEDQPMGIVDSTANSATIQLGMLNTFSKKTAWLFYDHDEVVKR
jgi:hypothetical protein